MLKILTHLFNPKLLLFASVITLSACSGLKGAGSVFNPPQAIEGAVEYSVTLESVVVPSLKKLIDETSELISRSAEPPPSHMGLRQRADQDVQRLLRLLRAQGYYDGTVSYNIEPSGPGFLVTLLVNPGTVYLLEEYNISYPPLAGGDNPAGLPDDLEDIGLYVGMWAESAPVADAENSLLNLLSDQGRPLATIIDRRVIIDHERTTMRVSLEVAPGPLTRFGTVLTQGADKVERDYFQKLIPWRTGDVFKQSMIEQYRSRLVETQLFDRVQVGSGKELNPDGTLPIVVDVQERKPRSIGFGAGYSTDQGLSGDASWEHRNLFGRQELVRLGLNASTSDQTVTADMRKPNYPAIDYSLLLNATGHAERGTIFDEQSGTAFVGMERKIGTLWTFRGGPLAEYSGLTSLATKERSNFALLGFSASARRDSTDNLLDPRRGTRLNVQTTPYTSVVGDQIMFLALESSGSIYHAVDKAQKFVFAGRYRLGTVMGEPTETLPLSKQLYAGGGGSIRGYKHRMAGPIGPEGVPKGGRSVAELGVEARIRVTDTIGIVPFLEGGTAYDSVAPEFPSNSLWAAGLGLRYFTAIGPLRADVAFPINGRDEIDSLFELYISIGQAF